MRVYVAGHNGLAGSALYRLLKAHNYELITATRQELDLRDPLKVDSFIKNERPDWVFIAAAVVGGIHANATYPVQFLLDNLKIQNNIIESSYRHNVRKLMFLGSNCAYPKLSPQPLKENMFLTGLLEPTNEAYAIAKISGIKLCKAYVSQHGANFISVIPTTMYGLNDNYHAENSHVLPMLMRRFHEAKVSGDKEVVMWGSGTPLREYMSSDDMASACLFLMLHHNAIEIGELINIGSGYEISIKELAQKVRSVVGLEAEIIMDPNRPDGMPRKLLDSSKLFSLGWRPKKNFDEGLVEMYRDFCENPLTRK